MSRGKKKAASFFKTVTVFQDNLARAAVNNWFVCHTAGCAWREPLGTCPSAGINPRTRPSTAALGTPATALPWKDRPLTAGEEDFSLLQRNNEVFLDHAVTAECW